jgi:hypothetical protein
LERFAVKESSIEYYLVKRVKAMGGEVRKVQWTGRKGAPDRLVMLPMTKCGTGWLTTGSAIWVELKAEGLAALFPHTPHERQQHREHERMRVMGQRVVVIDSYAGVEELLA